MTLTDRFTKHEVLCGLPWTMSPPYVVEMQSRRLLQGACPILHCNVKSVTWPQKAGVQGYFSDILGS